MRAHTWHVSVEVRGQPQVPVLTFHFVWEGSLIVYLSEHRASWPMSFQKFSCLHLPSCLKNTRFQVCAASLASSGSWGFKLGSSHLHCKYFISWAISPAPKVCFWDGTVSYLVIQCLSCTHSESRLLCPLEKLGACAVKVPHAWVSLYRGLVAGMGHLGSEEICTSEFIKTDACFLVRNPKGAHFCSFCLPCVCLPWLICGMTSENICQLVLTSLSKCH